MNSACTQLFQREEKKVIIIFEICFGGKESLWFISCSIWRWHNEGWCWFFLVLIVYKVANTQSQHNQLPNQSMAFPSGDHNLIGRKISTMLNFDWSCIFQSKFYLLLFSFFYCPYFLIRVFWEIGFREDSSKMARKRPPKKQHISFMHAWTCQELSPSWLPRCISSCSLKVN